jgi:DNA-binding CsgD family transcriptional regulator
MNQELDVLVNTHDTKVSRARARLPAKHRDPIMPRTPGPMAGAEDPNSRLSMAIAQRRCMEAAFQQAELLLRNARGRADEQLLMIQQTVAAALRCSEAVLREAYTSTDLTQTLRRCFDAPSQLRYAPSTPMGTMIGVEIRWVIGEAERENGQPESALHMEIAAASSEDAETTFQEVPIAKRTPPAITKEPPNERKRYDGPVTDRERSVLQLIGQGLSNKQIARRLKITPETVKSHTKHIFAKLGANTRAHAVACAARFSLLSGC